MHVNQTILKEVPKGEFETVSVLQADCEERFLKLIQDRKPVYYDLYEMPNIPDTVEKEIEKGGYLLGHLKEDDTQFYLMPKPREQKSPKVSQGA